MSREVDAVIFTRTARIIPNQPTAANPAPFAVTYVQDSVSFEFKDLTQPDGEESHNTCLKELCLALFCIRNQSEHEL